MFISTYNWLIASFVIVVVLLLFKESNKID